MSSTWLFFIAGVEVRYIIYERFLADPPLLLCNLKRRARVSCISQKLIFCCIFINKNITSLIFWHPISVEFFPIIFYLIFLLSLTKHIIFFFFQLFFYTIKITKDIIIRKCIIFFYFWAGNTSFIYVKLWYGSRGWRSLSIDCYFFFHIRLCIVVGTGTINCFRMIRLFISLRSGMIWDWFWILKILCGI